VSDAVGAVGRDEEMDKEMEKESEKRE